MHATARFLILVLTVALCCGSSSELTDAEIQAAIQRGIDTSWGNLIRQIPVVVFEGGIRGEGRWSSRGLPPVVGVAQRIYVLSDSDRIALAASMAASNGYGRSSTRAKLKPGFSFSVADARASVVALGVTTVVLEVGASTSVLNGLNPFSVRTKLAKWKSPSVQIVLKTDDRTVSPLTGAQYSALTHTTEVWDRSSYITFPACGFVLPPRAAKGLTGSALYVCAYSDFSFPVIEGGQKVKVIITSEDGERKEKEVDARIFGSR
jgi:hypothetical protein